MRELLFCLTTAFLAGCGARDAKPVEVAGEAPLGVSFGESVSTVREARPRLRFLPYAGWVEEMGAASVFRSAQYHFGDAPAGEEPSGAGRLRLVRLTARSVEETGAVVRRLDEAHGPHRYHGCTPVPARATPEEIAVLTWGAAGQVVYAEVLMSRMGDGRARVQQPVVVTVAEPRAGARALSRHGVQADCFSRTHGFR